MNLEYISSFSTWSVITCIFITVAAVILGLLYTYLRQSKKATISETLLRSDELKSDFNDTKWPIAGECSAIGGPVHDAKSDPVEYCTHIQSQIKQTQHRLTQDKIMAKLTRQQLEEERDIQRRQLEDIFRLMEENKEKFGVNDVNDVQDQMKLYVQ